MLPTGITQMGDVAQFGIILELKNSGTNTLDVISMIIN